MAATVIAALRRFLPAFLRKHHRGLGEARQRAVWAINHCRTPEMGGHLHACARGCTREFRFHSCNHRSCPQCGRQATAAWVERELCKRVGAPYFMVTFTLPEELRRHFFTPTAKQVYDTFFAAASSALSDTLANPRWLGAASSGFTTILHTWNQRLHFHPHLHCIVPGAGIAADGRVVTVKDANFLVPQKALMRIFRARLRDLLGELAKEHQLPDIDPAVWRKDWGVHLQPFGSGENIIKYLGRYVCRSAIGDSRIVSITDSHVTFRWKDRSKQDAIRTDPLEGLEFVKRYLRHVLPRGMRAIRYYGFCHPASKVRRERIAFHTGRPLFAAALAAPRTKPETPPKCTCCGGTITSIASFHPHWRPSRGPPQKPRSHA